MTSADATAKLHGMIGPENAIQRVASAFKDCLSDAEVLRTIDELFGDLGFEFDAEAEERTRVEGIGQRRSRAAGYLATLDLSLPPDRDRLMEVIGTKLGEWTEGREPGEERLKRLLRTLKNAGYEWDGTQVRPRKQSPEVAPPSPSNATSSLVQPTRTEPLTDDVPSVFISYAHEDQVIAHALANALRARGCRVWIDDDEMRIGDDLAERIAEAINSVDFLLAIISEDAVKSSWCKRELSIAVTEALNTKRVKVLPIRLGDVSLPPILTGIYSPRVDPANIEAMADKILNDMKRHRGGGGPSGGTPVVPRPVPLPSDPSEGFPPRPPTRPRRTPMNRSA